MTISDIVGLRDLRAFGGISVEGIRLDRNPDLRTTEGLDVLDGNSVEVVQNPNLETLIGFGAVEETSRLKIDGNKRLKSFGSLRNLSNVANAMIFWRTSIQDFEPLDGVQFSPDNDYNANVYFEGNGGLEDLPELKGKPGYVTISNNPNLTDVSGLLGLEKLYQVEVTNNSNLSRCHVEEVVGQLEFSEESNRPIIIEGNGSGDCAN